MVWVIKSGSQPQVTFEWSACCLHCRCEQTFVLNRRQLKLCAPWKTKTQIVHITAAISMMMHGCLSLPSTCFANTRDSFLGLAFVSAKFVRAPQFDCDIECPSADGQHLGAPLGVLGSPWTRIQGMGFPQWVPWDPGCYGSLGS